MYGKIKKIFEILDQSYIWYLFFLLISIILISFIEILGIGSIPILFSLILDNSNLQSENFFSSVISNIGFLKSLDYSKMIYLFSILIISVFLLKNILLAVLFYFQGKLIKKIEFSSLIKFIITILKMSHQKS